MGRLFPIGLGWVILGEMGFPKSNVANTADAKNHGELGAFCFEVGNSGGLGWEFVFPSEMALGGGDGLLA